MSGYPCRYGFSSEETKNLYRKFWDMKNDTEWENYIEFMEWASKNGYEKGKRLVKIDPSKKHGPKNSIYFNPDPVVSVKKSKEKRASIKSPYCANCNSEYCRRMNGAVGCIGWQKYWIKNWNENIYIPPIEPEDPNTKRFWQYEHPDLVREGICFIAEI